MKTNLELVLKFTAEVASESDAIFVTDLMEQIALAASWQYDKPKEIWTVEILIDQASQIQLEQFIKFIRQSLLIPLENIKISNLEQRDWLRENQESFPPLEIDCFYIYGSHISNPSPGKLFPLKIDAATAFGSGNHGSTKGCLEALSKLRNTISPYNILDIGCGSGILAMAAANLWPSANILASDIDPECVRVTLENCALNNLALIQVLEGDGFKNLTLQKEKPFNLIIANILATILCEIVKDIEESLSAEGIVILSGILETQQESVVKKYASAGLNLINRIQNEEWVTLIMKK